MTRHKLVEIDDSDIHRLKKYGVVPFDNNVTVRYVKDKIHPLIEINGGLIYE